MKKITFLWVMLLLLSINLSMKAQNSSERLQFYNDYKTAVNKKTAIINADPVLYQEALNNGWFNQMALGLKNAEDCVNRATGNKGGPEDSPTSSNGTCSTATPFCTQSGATYPAGVNTGTGESGPYYSCLGSEPNPAWFFLKIGTSGDLHITETNSSNYDVDFILWGPFTSQYACGSLTSDKVADCSYSGSATEYIDIASASVGQYYILLITNFSNSSTNISLTKTSGSATTDCNIIYVPQAPNATAATSISGTGFQANWTAASGDPYPATSFALDVSTQSNFASFVSGYNSLNVGNVLTYPVTGLSPGTTYYYRLRGENTSGQGPNSNIITVNTPSTPNPTSVSVSANPICNGSSTQLTANGSYGTVYWYTGSCGGTYITTGNPINVSPASTTTYYARNYYNSQFSSGCASATVTVDPVSVGGSINGTNSITYGSSTGTMTLSGHTGTVAKWQKKISTASDWSDISNTATTYSETPSSTGTWQYRAQVKSGSCSEAYSSVFSVSVAIKTLTIGGSFVPNNKVYDATVASSILTNNLTLVGKVGSDDVTLTAVAVFADKNAGNSKTVSLTGSTITGANASYYTLSLTGAPTASANITPKAINVTAQTDNRIYNGTASSSVAPVVDALQTGDVVSTSPTQVYNNKHVGTGKTMTASGLVINDGNSGNNYSVSYVPNATGVITAKAINVTAQTDNRIYNGTASSSVVPIVDALQTGDVVSTSPTQVYNNKNVGTGKTMTASGLVINDGNSGNNYSVSYVPNATGVITAKAINVTAQTDSRIYNGTTSSSVAPVVDALQTGDVVSTSPTQVYNNKNVGTGKTMTASGLVINDGNSGNNYSVSYVPNATGVITAKAINVTAQTDSRIYNGTASSSVAPIVDALQTGDVVSTSPTQVYNNKNVGTGKTMTASGLVINDGNSGNNYSVSYVPNATGVITAKAINVTAVSDSKIYDDNISSDGIPTIETAAIQTGDFVSTQPHQVYDTKFVGTGKTMTASGLVLNDGNNGNNYSIHYLTNTTGEIIPGPAHHFSITGPDEVVAGSASSNFTIQVYDQYENATTVTSATTFSLSTNSTGTTIIFNPASPVMSNGSGNTTFTYRDSKFGNYTITATRASGNDVGLIGKSATHSIEVNLTPWDACNTSPAAYGQTEYFPDGSAAPVYGKFELSATGLSTAQNDVHNFAYQTLGNKGTIIAHAVDIENGGWLGVEMRESCASNAKTVLIKSHIYNPNVIIGYRSNTGKSMSSVSQVTQLTSWLKIQRNGSQFTIYSSNNGTLWQKRYTTTVNMSTNILAGIFTESVRSDRTSIAQFDHVEVSSSLKSSEILDDETIATEQQVDIYPNPADELVNILMPDNESKVKVTMISMQGNVILTTIFYGSEAQINTSHINPGVYVLRFETEGNVITKRLVIM